MSIRCLDCNNSQEFEAILKAEAICDGNGFIKMEIDEDKLIIEDEFNVMEVTPKRCCACGSYNVREDNK